MHELTMATGNDFQVADLRPFGKAALDQRRCLKDFIVSLKRVAPYQVTKSTSLLR